MRALLYVLLLSVFMIAPAHAESTYDRVIKSGTIRCGYAVWPPYFIKDPNTGKKSGIFYDYVEEMALMLKLKVEWTEEVGWGDYIAALQADRFDLYCPFTFPNAGRAREADFTTPIMYIGMDAVVRMDDVRFDYHPEKINDPAVTIVTIEGATPQIMAYDDFPKAKKIDLPQLATTADTFMHVVEGKADLAFAEAMSAQQFLKAHPDKLKIVLLEQPLRFSGATLSMKHGEDKFRRMLDTATREMLYTGKIEKVITKYEKSRDLLKRVAKPYEATE